MKKTVVKYFVLISLMISGCTSDLKTKEIAKAALKENATILIDNVFDLRYVENHSIAFGLLGSIKKNIRVPIIFTLTISATLLALLLIWKIRNNTFRILLPFFVILGGAYGNILDRLFNGFVTDFFHVHYFYEYNFPVFNVADILINIGLILILLQWKSFNPVFDNLLKKPKPVE